MYPCNKDGTLSDKQVKAYIKDEGIGAFVQLLNEPQVFQVSYATGLYNRILHTYK